MKTLFLVAALFVVTSQSAFSLERSDRLEIEKIVRDYTESWNDREGAGFAENYTEDADFINIYGMHFKTREIITQRHVEILKTFLKGSKLLISSIDLREAKPGTVIAHVRWTLEGYRSPGMDAKSLGETRTGVFTQTVIHDGRKWAITASQNTMAPLR